MTIMFNVISCKNGDFKFSSILEIGVLIFNRPLDLVYRQLVNSINDMQVYLEAYQDRPISQLNSSSIKPYTKQDKDQNIRSLLRSNYRSYKTKNDINYRSSSEN